MSNKPNWLRATRTVGGEEVVNLRVDTGPPGWWLGKPHLIGEIRRNGFLYTCAWSLDCGMPIEQFSKYRSQALVQPADPESVLQRGKTCGCHCSKPEGEHYVNCPAAPATPVVKVGQVWRSNEFTVTVKAVANNRAMDSDGNWWHVARDPNWTLVSEAPEAPANTRTLHAPMTQVTIRDAPSEPCTKHDECWHKDGHEGKCVTMATAEAEWKPGQEALAPHHFVGPVKIVAISDGWAWVRYAGEGPSDYDRLPGLSVALKDLRKPAPKTRDVVTVWEYRRKADGALGWAGADYGREHTPTGRSYRFKLSEAFPGVPVDDQDGE